MQLHWNYLYICRNIFWQQFISIKVFLLPQVNWVSFSFLCQNACLAGISCFENTQLIIGKSHLLVKEYQLARYSFFHTQPDWTPGSYRGFSRISLVRISLLHFLKTFHKYLPYANFGLFISLAQFFGQKIAKNRTNEINSPKFA